MRSIVKKCSMLFALIFGVLAVTAAPVDFVSDKALMVVSIDTGRIFDNPTLKELITAKFGKVLQQAPFKISVDDLRGQIVVAYSSPAKGVVQVTLIGEFPVETVALLKKELAADAARQNVFKATKVDGKDAFTDGKAQLIFWSESTMIWQGFVEGEAPFEKISSRKKVIGRGMIFAAVDIGGVMETVGAKNNNSVLPEVKDIIAVIGSADVKGNIVDAMIMILCKNPQSAKALMQKINQLKQIPEAALFLEKVNIVQTDSKIMATAAISIEELFSMINKAVAE